MFNKLIQLPVFTMLSLANTRKGFNLLTEQVCSADMRNSLLSLPTVYEQGDEYMHTDSMRMIWVFRHARDVIIQLGTCHEHEGVTRDDARQFIALFDGLLTPTFEAAMVPSKTVGQEIHRLLNHMAFSMRTW